MSKVLIVIFTELATLFHIVALTPYTHRILLKSMGYDKAQESDDSFGAPGWLI